MRLITSAIYVCLPVLFASVAASQSGVSDQSRDKAATGTTYEPEQADQQEDIFDRVFSPLDNAVSDINRDLNEGDGSTAPQASE